MSLRKTFVCGGAAVEVQVVLERDGRVRAHVDGRALEFVATPLPGGGWRLQSATAMHTAFVAPRGQRVQARVDGHTFDLEVARGRGTTAAAASGVIEAPMTGTVLDVPVRVGDMVQPEQVVAVLNAMKMEHKLTAGIRGKVVEVGCRAGEIVDQGKLLVRVVPVEST